MEPLSNADIADMHSDLGFAPFALPKAKSSHTGVSVDYAPADDKRWFVIRASYGREDLAADTLIAAGHYVYVARRYTWIELDHRPKRILQNLIPNILFVYATPKEADIIVKDNDTATPSPCRQLSRFLSYYYDHFTLGCSWLGDWR